MTNKPSPILIVGAPRSGTTWIGQTVAQSPNLRYIHEPFNKEFPNKEFGLQIHNWLYDAEGGSQRNEIKQAFDNLIDKGPWQWTLKKNAAKHDWKTPLRFIKILYRQLRYPERILVKDPLAVMAADWLHETFGFQVICTIRKPLSYAASMKRVGWGFNAAEFFQQQHLIQRKLAPFVPELTAACENAGDIVDQHCLQWNLTHYVINQYRQKYPSWLFIKHEELAENPEQGFRDIFEYLDLRLTDEISEYIRKYSFAQDSSRQSSFQYRPRNARSTMDSWKTTLTDDEVARVETKTKAIAEALYH